MRIGVNRDAKIRRDGHRINIQTRFTRRHGRSALESVSNMVGSLLDGQPR